MGVFLGIIIFIGYVFLVVAMRSLTTLFHELGHAIPALMFTKEKVTVYIGTYGSNENGFTWTLGRLRIFFRFNVFNWNMSLCQHHVIAGFWKNILVILGGPVASLMIALPLLLMVIYYSLSDLKMALLLIFVLAAMVDFVVNIYPFGRTIYLDDGSIIRTDGQKLRFIFSRLKLPQSYFILEQLYQEQKYEKLVQVIEPMLDQGDTHKATYNLAINTYKQQNQIKKAISVYHKMNNAYNLTYEDFHDVGRLYGSINQPQESLKYFNHCIHQHHRDERVLYDRAMAYKELGEFGLAKMDLDASIYNNSKFLNSYRERAFVRLKLGLLDDAYLDLTYAKDHDDNDPFLYYYFGLYYELKSMKQKALIFFRKAKEMGIDFHGINYKIHMLTS